MVCRLLCTLFLAAMSSSRSDVVTQCFRLSVPFFSFSVLGVCSAFFLVLKCFNRISRNLKGVASKIKGCFQ